MATKGSFESRAIVVVDPQPDFFEGGTLPVVGATRTSERIATFLRDNGDDYSLKVVTQDWHVDPGDHWSESPDYIVAWPAHCAADSRGAQIHESLANVTWDDVIRKGQHEAAYSGFDGLSEQGVSLGDILRNSGIRKVDIVGFATDYCVKATVLDALARGFEVNVALDLCVGVKPDSTRDAIAVMRASGATMVESKDI